MGLSAKNWCHSGMSTRIRAKAAPSWCLRITLPAMSTWTLGSFAEIFPAPPAAAIGSRNGAAPASTGPRPRAPASSRPASSAAASCAAPRRRRSRVDAPASPIVASAAAPPRSGRRTPLGGRRRRRRAAVGLGSSFIRSKSIGRSPRRRDRRSPSACPCNARRSHAPRFDGTNGRCRMNATVSAIANARRGKGRRVASGRRRASCRCAHALGSLRPRAYGSSRAPHVIHSQQSWSGIGPRSTRVSGDNTRQELDRQLNDQVLRPADPQGTGVHDPRRDEQPQRPPHASREAIPADSRRKERANERAGSASTRRRRRGGGAVASVARLRRRGRRRRRRRLVQRLPQRGAAGPVDRASLRASTRSRRLRPRTAKPTAVASAAPPASASAPAPAQRRPGREAVQRPAPRRARHADAQSTPRPERGKKILGYIRLGGKVPVEPALVKDASGKCSRAGTTSSTAATSARKWATLDLKNPQVRLGITPPNLEDVLPYKYAYNTAHGTPLYRSVPSKEEMLKYEPYLEAAKRAKKKAERDKEKDEAAAAAAPAEDAKPTEPADDGAGDKAGAHRQGRGRRHPRRRRRRPRRRRRSPGGSRPSDKSKPLKRQARRPRAGLGLRRSPSAW